MQTTTETTTARQTRKNRSEIVREIKILSGQSSDKVSAKYLKENGYLAPAKPDSDSLRQALSDAFSNYGLALEECCRPARFPKTWQRLHNNGCVQFAQLLISTGGPENGILFVISRRKILAAYYYDADWGTFNRCQITEKTGLGIIREAYEEYLGMLEFTEA
jgi:hypothetical protein